MLTAQVLQKAMPGLPYSKAQSYAPLLAAAMREGNITTTRRAAAFLAQLGHESVSLRYFEEIADGSAYEGRRDLGNVQKGDGRRYKGRGPIQLTGRNNYRKYGKLLNLPLEARPEIAARPENGFRIAVAFWTQMGGNALADAGDFREITRRINGGFNGWADRTIRWVAIQRLRDAILPESPVARRLRIYRERLAALRAAVRRDGGWGKNPGRRSLADRLKRAIGREKKKLK